MSAFSRHGLRVVLRLTYGGRAGHYQRLKIEGILRDVGDQERFTVFAVGNASVVPQYDQAFKNSTEGETLLWGVFEELERLSQVLNKHALQENNPCGDRFMAALSSGKLS